MSTSIPVSAGGESRAKEQMLLASCLAGMAFNSAGLGVSHALAYKLIGDGYIPAVKTGSAFKIPKIDVVGFVMEEGERRAG